MLAAISLARLWLSVQNPVFSTILSIRDLFAASRFGGAMAASGYTLGIACTAKWKFLTAGAGIWV